LADGNAVVAKMSQNITKHLEEIGFLNLFFLMAPSYTTILLKDLGLAEPTDGMVM